MKFTLLVCKCFKTLSKIKGDNHFTTPSTTCRMYIVFCNILHEVFEIAFTCPMQTKLTGLVKISAYHKITINSIVTFSRFWGENGSVGFYGCRVAKIIWWT